MSVLIETSVGDLTVDLFVDACPKLTLNFLKLCKIKFYNNCLFYSVQKDFIAQTGDPANKGMEGSSIHGILKGDRFKYIEDEISVKLPINRKGLLCTGNLGPDMNTSNFFFTLSDQEYESLRKKHSVIGEVVEGFDVLENLNSTFVDGNYKPYQNVKIKHTMVLEDPFPDPENLVEPENSPDSVKEADFGRIDDGVDFKALYSTKEDKEKVKEKIEESNANNRAIILELLEDIPDADIKPPDNVLFVCKLNPITQDDDLEMIFSRFGAIKSCKIVRDWKSGASLQYAFIEFESVEACEEAYVKMDNVVIDERRIHVDFSQSVQKLYMQYSNEDKEVKEDANYLELPNDSRKLKMKENRNFMINKTDKELVFEGKKQRNTSEEKVFNDSESEGKVSPRRHSRDSKHRRERRDSRDRRERRDYEDSRKYQDSRDRRHSRDSRDRRDRRDSRDRRDRRDYEDSRKYQDRRDYYKRR